RLQVVGAVDRRVLVAVVGPGNEDAPDLRARQTLELRGDALDRPPRLGIRVEEVAGDDEEVDLLLDREIDGCLEGGALALTLRRRALAEVGVTSTQVDVRGVEQTEHPVADGLLSRRRARSDEAMWSRPGRNPSAGPGLARARRPLALARHPESRGSL